MRSGFPAGDTWESTCRPAQGPWPARCRSPPRRGSACRTRSSSAVARSASARRRRGSSASCATRCAAARGPRADPRVRPRAPRRRARGPSRRRYRRFAMASSRSAVAARHRRERRAGTRNRFRVPAALTARARAIAAGGMGSSVILRVRLWRVGCHSQRYVRPTRAVSVRRVNVHCVSSLGLTMRIFLQPLRRAAQHCIVCRQYCDELAHDGRAADRRAAPCLARIPARA